MLGRRYGYSDHSISDDDESSSRWAREKSNRPKRREEILTLISFTAHQKRNFLFVIFESSLVDYCFSCWTVKDFFSQSLWHNINAPQGPTMRTAVCFVVRRILNHTSGVQSLSPQTPYRMRPSSADRMDCKSHDPRSLFSRIKNSDDTQVGMSNEYIVSRNGVVLTWKEIYQQYPLDSDRCHEVNPPMEAS